MAPTTSSLLTGGAGARVGAASLVVGGFLLGRKGAAAAGSVITGNVYVMGGRLCGIVAFCIAAGLLMGNTTIIATDSYRSATSKFSASRASWDEDEAGISSANSSGASTRGGLVKGVIALGVRLARDFVVPFLDAMRILLLDLKTPYRRGDAYFLSQKEAPSYEYSAPLTSEEKAIEDVSKAAKRVAEGTRSGVKRAGYALRTLLDGFT